MKFGLFQYVMIANDLAKMSMDHSSQDQIIMKLANSILNAQVAY